jgi:hypothetical protein
MKATFSVALLLCLLSGASCASILAAQQTASGLDMRATLTAQAIASNELTQAPRSGDPMILGSHAIVYPTIKINENWFIVGAVQFASRPFYFSELTQPGYGAKGTALQAALYYSHVFKHGSVLVHAGEMSTAFGSFMLRYDDADNALTDIPIEYGYYYSPVSILGVAGAQVDASVGKFDARAQFANSSPDNPRSLLAHDQYGNWVAGAGYMVRQGFRIGVSAYRGPYLDRKHLFFAPGEANPNKLPATAGGLDINWAHGHTSAQGELQRFVMTYGPNPTFRETAGYGELKQVLSPRWYVAERDGFSIADAGGNALALETAAGFRPDRFQLIKVGYEFRHSSTGAAPNDNVLAIQLVTTIHRSFGHE